MRARHIAISTLFSNLAGCIIWTAGQLNPVNRFRKSDPHETPIDQIGANTSLSSKVRLAVYVFDFKLKPECQITVPGANNDWSSQR